jgi:hypothetical protein
LSYHSRFAILTHYNFLREKKILTPNIFILYIYLKIISIDSYDRVVVRDKVDSSLTDLNIMTRDEYDRIVPRKQRRNKRRQKAREKKSVYVSNSNIESFNSMFKSVFTKRSKCSKHLKK